MASLISDPNGRKRISFIQDGKRNTIYLGQASKADANQWLAHIEHLIAASRHGGAIPAPTAAWIAERPADEHEKLARFELVAPRESFELSRWLDSYLRGRTDLKPKSLRKLEETQGKLVEFFGASCPLRSITPQRAAEWREWLAGQGLSEASTRTHSGNAKTIFAEAARRKIIESPFTHLKSGSTASKPDRYVTPEESAAIVDKLAGTDWKLLFGLARYAGLRIPSESHLLTWDDVDLDRMRLNVRSPKTEHHAGHERRTVPISPALSALLTAHKSNRPDGRLVTMRGAGHVRRRILAAVEAAGLSPWPKLFQALRSSCEKEWAMSAPQYAVSRWIGHSITVSGKHYANDVPDELYARVTAQNAAQTVKEMAGNNRTVEVKALPQTQSLPATYVQAMTGPDMEAAGIEPASRDHSIAGIYMRIRFFIVVPGVGKRHSPPGIRRLFLVHRPTSESADQPAVFG